jgi:hypothetical protein
MPRKIASLPSSFPLLLGQFIAPYHVGRKGIVAWAAHIWLPSQEISKQTGGLVAITGYPFLIDPILMNGAPGPSASMPLSHRVVITVIAEN